MTQTEHLHDPLTGQHVAFIETGEQTHGELLRAKVRLDPGGWVPLHAHLRQDERVEVLAGTVSVRVGRRERTLAVGDSAAVPRRNLHRVRNAGDTEAVFVLDVRPARRMEGAMRALFAVMGLLRPITTRRRRA